MNQGPRIPELAQRDRFVRRAVQEWRVYTLADEERAGVASTRSVGRTVQLFWSSPLEAKRWAEALAGADQLQEIPLQEFAAAHAGSELDLDPDLESATLQTLGEAEQ